MEHDLSHVKHWCCLKNNTGENFIFPVKQNHTKWATQSGTPQTTTTTTTRHINNTVVSKGYLQYGFLEILDKLLSVMVVAGIEGDDGLAVQVVGQLNAILVICQSNTQVS